MPFGQAKGGQQRSIKSWLFSATSVCGLRPQFSSGVPSQLSLLRLSLRPLPGGAGTGEGLGRDLYRGRAMASHAALRHLFFVPNMCLTGLAILDLTT